MNKTIIKHTAAILLAMGMMTSASQAEDISVSGDLGIASQYVWRGVTQTSGKTAVQGDLGISKDGFSAAVWFSNAYASPAPQFAGRDVVEFDWTVDYSGEISDVGYSIGAIGYTYLYDSMSNFPEVYAGLSYGPVSLTAYYNVADSANKAYLAGDLWIDLGASTAVAGFDVSGTLSYANWKNDPTRAAASFKDGLNLITVGISKDVAIADGTMTPSLTVTVPVIGKDAAGNTNIYGVAATEEFVAAVNFAY